MRASVRVPGRACYDMVYYVMCLEAATASTTRQWEWVGGEEEVEERVPTSAAVASATTRSPRSFQKEEEEADQEQEKMAKVKRCTTAAKKAVAPPFRSVLRTAAVECRASVR